MKTENSEMELNFDHEASFHDFEKFSMCATGNKLNPLQYCDHADPETNPTGSPARFHQQKDCEEIQKPSSCTQSKAFPWKREPGCKV